MNRTIVCLIDDSFFFKSHIRKNLISFLSSQKESMTFTKLLVIGEDIFSNDCFIFYKECFDLDLKLIFSVKKNNIIENIDRLKGFLVRFQDSIECIEVQLDTFDDLDDFKQNFSLYESSIGSKLQFNFKLNFDNNFRDNDYVYQLNKIDRFDKFVTKFDKHLNVQRDIINGNWAKYPEHVERWLQSDHWLMSEHRIDIPLSLVNQKFKSNEHVCKCGTILFVVHQDGKVTRCFSNQVSGFNCLGDLSKSHEIRFLKDNTPCFCTQNSCLCYKKLVTKGYAFKVEDINIRYNRKYDIAIIGFGWAYNYGAVLTNYGMMRFLQKNGFNPLLVDKPRAFVNNNYTDVIYSNNFARNFNEKYFPENISRIYDDNNDMRELNSLADIFILGSDQTLRYDLHKNGLWYVGMDFLNSDKKKIAYSSGLGHFKYLGDPWYKINLQYYLSEFDYVAVREPSSVYVLKEQFNVDAVSVVDPMLFLANDDYLFLASKSNCKKCKNYLLAFILTPDKRYKKHLDFLSKKYNLDLVVVAEFWLIDILKGYGFENVISPSVEDWCWYMMNASLVITDSFHCVYTLISICPPPPFLLIINNDVIFKRGMARFVIFEEIPQLRERIVYNIDDISGYPDPLVFNNYNDILKSFDEKKCFSIKWLLNAIDSPKPDNLLPSNYNKLLNTINNKINILNNKYNNLERKFDLLNHKLDDSLKKLDALNSVFNFSSDKPMSILDKIKKHIFH